mgnify:CR=1 FL=1
MTVSRNTFFLGILLITTTPFLLQKLAWLANAKRTKGVMHYVGKSQSGQIVSIYPVIRFYDGKDSVWFNGASDILLNRGDMVPVLYQRDNHTEAKIDNFISVWGDTVGYAAVPAIIILIVFLQPEIVPRRARVRLAPRSPFIFVEP